MTDELRKNAICGTCTLKLVVIAYRRAPWFRLLREPLKLGMRCLSRIHHVDTGVPGTHPGLLQMHPVLQGDS